MCDNPLCVGHGRTQAQIVAEIRRTIKSSGWAVMGVFDTPGFAYTVGLTAKGSPELYYSFDAPGEPDSLTNAQKLLNKLADRIVNSGEHVGHNSTVELVDDAATPWTCLFEIRLNKKPMGKAYDIYGSRFSALEVSLIHTCPHE